MEKYIYDEQIRLHYELIDDYYYPCLAAPESPSVGIWGLQRHKYLREHKKVMYTGMLLSGKLNTHLEEIGQSATQMFEQLVSKLKTQEGISEELKGKDQLTWIGAINSIQNRATKIVNNELIFD